MSSVAVVSMDIHKMFSKGMSMGPDSAILAEARIPHGDRRDMERYFAQFPRGTPVVMEATFNWPWIADVAEAMGLEPHLAHPPRMRQYARGLAKTDRKDAIFQGKIWLNREIFPESYRAPRDVRRLRDLFRLRLLWVSKRTSLKNNVHGQLFQYGLVLDDKASDLFSPKGRRILEALPLENPERQSLERRLAVIDDLDRHIKDIEKEIKKNLRKDARAKWLMSIPGIGEITAYAILVEVGDFRRFPNGRALASYAGLLPLPRESAEHEGERHTSAACNRFLRWAFLEAVTGAVRGSRRMNILHARVRAKNRQQSGKARVAVARQIAELAHLLVTRETIYQEQPPRRPGCARVPLHPVAAAQPALTTEDVDR
jgi:transposase